jgi:hypothetical protein
MFGKHGGWVIGDVGAESACQSVALGDIGLPWRDCH